MGLNKINIKLLNAKKKLNQGNKKSKCLKNEVFIYLHFCSLCFFLWTPQISESNYSRECLCNLSTNYLLGSNTALAVTVHVYLQCLHVER